MTRKSFTFFIGLFLTAASLIISTPVLALTGDSRPAQQSTLPQITFLGEGPQTFTIEPPLRFLIKTYQDGKFLFVIQESTTYEAKKSERVWTIDRDLAENIRLFHESKDYGKVPAGCVVNFVQIEDNPDTRRNTFYINGKVLLVAEQGWVSYGTFTVPEAGDLTFYAEDSIGMIIEICPGFQTAVPSPSVTGSVVGSVTPTLSGTPGTATVTPVGTASTATVIAPTAGVSVTPTATFIGGDIITLTPVVTGTTTAPPPVTETPSGTATTIPATATSVSVPSITPTTGSVAATATPTNSQPVVVPSATATFPAGGVVIPSQTPVRTSTSAVPNPPGNATSTMTAVAGQGTAVATASRTPTLTAVAPGTLITATPISTPGMLPVTGGEPGPREIAAISAMLFGLFTLVGTAWWFLLRVYNHGR